MNVNDLIEISKKKSGTKLNEIREQLTFQFFKRTGQNTWDNTLKRIVVIGSGIGGMASGALFAKIGHRVSVLELHPTLIGGHGRCYTFHGLQYSMGPQYVWEFGDGGVGDRFLTFLGLKERIPLVPMNVNGFERLFIGRKLKNKNHYFLDFKVPMGFDRFRKEMIELFPDEADKLNALFNDMIEIFKTYKSFLLKNSANEGRLLLTTKFLLTSGIPMSIKIKLGRTIYMSVKEFFDNYQISNLIRRILYGHGGIFAENEAHMSAIAYIIGTGNYHEGAWYPKKGFKHFFESIAGFIRSSGGSVETGKKVIQLKTEKNSVTEAICEDGTSYPCDFIFSGISPRLTYSLLDKPDDSFDYEPSHSIPICCIGLKKGLDGVSEMKGTNYWWQDGNQVDYNTPDVTASPQMMFIGSPTANGISDVEKIGKDGLVVYLPGNYQQEKKIYEQGRQAVKQFKKKLAEDIIEIIDSHIFPGIRSKLLFVHIFSSLDIEKDTNSEMGNAYGRRLTVDEILKGTIKGEHYPANLYNVSATKNSPGIAGGIFTAELIFKELTGLVV